MPRTSGTANQPTSTSGRASAMRLIVVDMFQPQITKVAQPVRKTGHRHEDQVAIIAIPLARKGLKRALGGGRAGLTATSRNTRHGILLAVLGVG